MSYSTPPCPDDAAHGRLLDWPGAYTAWYCPARAHEGRAAFYTTDLVPVPTSERRQTSQQRSEAAPGARRRRGVPAS